MRKVALATQMIEKRIAHADHILVGIPGERQLAEELGLSRTTVRTALQQLMDQGTLVRQENGRISVAEPGDGRLKKRTIGIAAPPMASADFDRWREGIRGVLEGQPVTLRPVAYAHWADPALQDALAHFDGMFFIPPAEKIPAWLTTKMLNAACRVVVLDEDESAAGLPSVTLFPPAAERKLFDHLRRLGHQRIDCLNAQAEDGVILGRIAEWKRYLEEHGLPGQLRSQAVEKPFESAYQLIRDALKEGRPVASALFCTTGPAAIGAMRALHEAGLEIGVDVSVCAVNGEGIGQYLLRSLTELESPPRALYLQRAAGWMLGEDLWEGPLLIQPNDVPLFEGESTGPAPASPIVSPVRG
ncbi:MAG: GntR family transcriptional regulator [Capsulimonas sp.]|nr:GntR family transcriptional regulator [Capsulimonas sp.]